MKQFQSKATLFADLVEHLLDEMREETVSYVRKFPYGLPRIMARVDHVWELYKKPKALAMVEVMLGARGDPELSERSAEHTSELQSLMRISYAVYSLKKKTN